MPDEQQSDDNQNSSEVTLEKLQIDLDQAMQGWKRTAADFENFKRQKERENKELLDFAKEVTVVKLLPTLDTLSQALKHLPQMENNEGDFSKAYNNWQVGISGILIQLDKTFSELGVKKIEAIGKKFDPNFHEAIREVESEAEDGVIVDELQTGFELNGKVIRPSQVVINKKK